MTKDNVFDSSPTQPDRRVEASHVIDALAIDAETAADAWVRFAKTRFRGMMDVLNVVRIDELEAAAHPLWTKQESVCFSIHNRDTRAEAVWLIEYLVDRLAHEIMKIQIKFGNLSGRRTLVLVGALSVKAHDLGEGFYNFVLKQQLTVGTHER
jgi:hypothetical protein